jgi:Ni/Co efflux regulator RcnB
MDTICDNKHLSAGKHSSPVHGKGVKSCSSRSAKENDMKRFLSTAAALLLFAGTAGGAMAAPWHNGHDDHHSAPMRGPMHHSRHADWHQGGHIGHSDWSRGRHVDYRAHHLRRPPRGYEWREVDGNYVLAAAATGLIASIILANQ